MGGANLEFVAGLEPVVLQLGLDEDHQQFATAFVDSLEAFHDRSDWLVSDEILTNEPMLFITND